jgi:hypothetical protein
MRIGTWNVDARWDRRHERLVTGQVCDVWLLTETPNTLVLPGFRGRVTAGRMSRGQHWAAVFARDLVVAADEPDVATAAAQVGEVTLWSSILPGPPVAHRRHGPVKGTTIGSGPRCAVSSRGVPRAISSGEATGTTRWRAECWAAGTVGSRSSGSRMIWVSRCRLRRCLIESLGCTASITLRYRLAGRCEVLNGFPHKPAGGGCRTTTCTYSRFKLRAYEPARDRDFARSLHPPAAHNAHQRSCPIPSQSAGYSLSLDPSSSLISTSLLASVRSLPSSSHRGESVKKAVSQRSSFVMSCSQSICVMSCPRPSSSRSLSSETSTPSPKWLQPDVQPRTTSAVLSCSEPSGGERKETSRGPARGREVCLP